jgi:hypothetical protein
MRETSRYGILSSFHSFLLISREILGRTIGSKLDSWSGKKVLSGLHSRSSAK